MKTIPLFYFISVAACSLLAFGCSTVDSRIKEKSALFASLTPEQQQVIRHGFIAVGYTPDMVYMALDKPEKIIPGGSPTEETWVYHNFYSANGSSLTPATRVSTSTGVGSAARGSTSASAVAANRAGYNNTFQVESDPAAENIKTEAAIRVHVKFLDGKVSDIQIIGEH